MIMRRKIEGEKTTTTYIGLWGRQLELCDGYLGLFHAGWTTGCSDDVLIENYTFNEFSVFDRATDFLHYADISEIDV